MCALPLSMFNIPVTLYGLLGTPGNLELRERKGVVRLTFNDAGLVGLVGDVDADQSHNVARNGAVYEGHLLGNL